MIVLFKQINIGCYINGIPIIIPTLNSWYSSHLVVMHYFLKVMLQTIC